MKAVRPVYMQDYAPGFSMFTTYSGNVLSEGISWLEHIQEAVVFIQRLAINAEKFSDSALGKPASHVLMVVDEYTGIESSDKGVEFCELAKFFDNPRVQVVCREPQGLDEQAVRQMLDYAIKLEGKEQPYDYTGLLGALIRFISPVNKLLPMFNRLPNPLSIGGLYCSAFDADCKKHTDRYSSTDIFKKYHVTRIDPVLWWYLFPWKPLRFDKKREA